MKNICFLLSALLALSVRTSTAQTSRIQYTAALEATGTTGGVVPFWMRSNRYGSIPLAGASSRFLGSAKKEYDLSEDGYFGYAKNVDWGMGFEGRVNTNITTSEFILTEAYLKGRLGPFQLKAGRSKETMGLTGDTTLTSGSFAVSGNALGIPKIEISFPEYYTLPVFGGLFAIKGNFAHGWVGKTATQIPKGSLTETNTFFHQKSFYGRLGKPEWRLKLYGGTNHQVYWGNEYEIYGDNYELNNFGSSFHIISGKKYGGRRVGNHLGSVDIGMEYNFDALQLTAYRQTFYDIGAMFHLANLRDGLNGIALKNLNVNDDASGWKTILFEFVHTKNQAGELWSQPIPSGDENYYNNSLYRNGWAYQNVGIGTPLMSTVTETRVELPVFPGDYFINNRVVALHLGFQAYIQRWTCLVKASWSENRGTYGTGNGHSEWRPKALEPIYGTFGIRQQFSAIIESARTLENGYVLAGEVSLDKGDLLYNSVGIRLNLSKRF